MMPFVTKTFLSLWMLAMGLPVLAWSASESVTQSVFVCAGAPLAVEEKGKPWVHGKGYLECSGTGNSLVAAETVGQGDFQVHARLAIHDLEGSAASFVIGSSHFGFCGRHGESFVEGPLFGDHSRPIPDVRKRIPRGEPFLLEVKREADQLTFSINGTVVYTQKVTSEPLGELAFRPWRSRMQLLEFAAEGNLVEIPPAWPKALQAQSLDLFVANTEGYHTFRIPSILVTREGTVLAFCEGRKSGRGDAGDIDLLMRRSTDLGKTWSAIQVVWDDQDNTCGNPAPVADQETGRIWLALTWNLGTDSERQIMANQSQYPRKLFMTYSDDDGQTWKEPVEMPKLRQPYWRWYASGPDKGIQLTRGPHAGRLLIPCNHSDHRDPKVHPYRSHVIYSDDHGETWELGEAVGPMTNESTIVELADGSVLDNMRSYHGQNCRAVAVSHDGGAAWSDVRLDKQLIEPVCQASILRYSWKDPQDPSSKDRILFCNPASKSREKLTIRISYDSGKSWSVSRLLYGKSAAYSCLMRLPDARIGVLFERDAYSRITFVPLSLNWLEETE